MLLLKYQKSNVGHDRYLKSMCQKYHLYTKSKNQKYYLSTSVVLNVKIRQPNVIRMHFVRNEVYVNS